MIPFKSYIARGKPTKANVGLFDFSAENPTKTGVNANNDSGSESRNTQDPDNDIKYITPMDTDAEGRKKR